MNNTGKIVQVIGPVVDIRFDADSLPSIKNAILIKKSDTEQMTAGSRPAYRRRYRQMHCYVLDGWLSPEHGLYRYRFTD
jgi:hypothetical protein